MLAELLLDDDLLLALEELIPVYRGILDLIESNARDRDLLIDNRLGRMTRPVVVGCDNDAIGVKGRLAIRRDLLARRREECIDIGLVNLRARLIALRLNRHILAKEGFCNKINADIVALRKRTFAPQPYVREL